MFLNVAPYKRTILSFLDGYIPRLALNKGLEGWFLVFIPAVIFFSLSTFVFILWQDASLCYDLDASPGELQSDVMFREGVTFGGQVTYTPRLIAMDLKGETCTVIFILLKVYL